MPYVVKPVSDGSSVGVFIVREQEDILKVKYMTMEKLNIHGMIKKKIMYLYHLKMEKYGT